MGFIEEFVQGVSREVSKVQARSQEMLQTYSISTQMHELERKKTAKLLHIGRLIFDKYAHSTVVEESQLVNIVKEIGNFEEEITALQSELDSLRAQNDPDTPASKKADSKAGFKPTPGFECPKCHAPASKEKSFCPICGESIHQDSKEDDVIDIETNGEH